MANFSLPSGMEYSAEFLRGWPVDGGLELDYPIATGQTLAIGDLVKPVVESGVVKVTKTVSGDEALAIGHGAGIVVRGNGDDKSAAEVMKAVVLWGKYIVRTQKFDTTNINSTALIGSGVVAGANGAFVLAAAAKDAALGTIIEYKAASGSIPAYIVVAV